MTTIEIQQALKRQGFDPGPLDGAMGPLTRGAIATFEAKHGLKADGEPDGAFLDALLGERRGRPMAAVARRSGAPQRAA